MPASLDGPVQSSAHHVSNAGGYRGAGPAGESAADSSADVICPATSSTVRGSTANVSTTEQEERAQFHQREHVADATSDAGGPKQEEASGGGTRPSSAADHQDSAGNIGLGHAVLAAAQELVHHCQIPGVSEAAIAVCMMANLVTDSRENARASESRLRQCSTVVMALKRAAKVVDQVSGQHVVCWIFCAQLVWGELFSWLSLTCASMTLAVFFAKYCPCPGRGNYWGGSAWDD